MEKPKQCLSAVTIFQYSNWPTQGRDRQEAAWKHSSPYYLRELIALYTKHK